MYRLTYMTLSLKDLKWNIVYYSNKQIEAIHFSFKYFPSSIYWPLPNILYIIHVLEFENADSQRIWEMVCKLWRCTEGTFQINKIQELASQCLTKRLCFQGELYMHTPIRMHKFIYKLLYIPFSNRQITWKVWKSFSICIIGKHTKPFCVKIVFILFDPTPIPSTSYCQTKQLKASLLKGGWKYSIVMVFSNYLFFCIARNWNALFSILDIKH